ncbi:hypothetical protein FQN54_001935 [Arachnomyces sp. PD_36]|nr:hypothetical protein FQN54_001935 [Arachnomyces sp. PD_36]
MVSSNPPNDSISGDPPLDVEKVNPETPSQSDSKLGIDSQESVARQTDKENEGQPPTSGDDDAEQVTDQDGEPIERTESQAARLGKKKAVVIVFAISVSLFLAALDMTIVATALPTIAAYFHASESGYAWIASSYLLANAASIPLWGKLSDIWGRKPIVLFCNVVFLVGSLICALAQDMTTLLAGRAVQGLGGGGLIVLSNIIISDLFSIKERPIYLGFLGATWAVAGALGPVVGGALTQEVSWRWCFYINLPVGGVALLILILLLKIQTPKTPFIAGIRAIDWIGTLTICGGTVMFLFALEFGGISFPWNSATVICLFVFGAVTIGLFILNEWKFAKYPIMPLRLFNNPSSAIILISAFCHAAVFISGSYFLPLYFQTVLNASPILSGIYTFPTVLTTSAGSALVGFFIRKTGRYPEAIQFGFVLTALGFGLFIDLKSYASWPRIIIYQIIAGIGIGPNFQALLIALHATVKPSDVAAATAMFGFVRQIATSCSVVLGGVVYQNVMAQQRHRLVSSLGPETAKNFASAFSGINTEALNALEPDQKATVAEVYTFAFQRDWIFYTALAGTGCILSFFIRRVELSHEHEIVKTGLEEQERVRLEAKADRKREKAEKAAKNGKEESGENV